jgi:hypothetical protein
MLLLTVFACVFEMGPRRSELEDARKLWEAVGPTHYRYVEDEWAFAPFEGPVEIEVDDGEIVAALVVETDQPASAARHLTIEDLFDAVEAELDRKPDDIAVEYDETYGFPASVDVDPIENAIDDEHGFTAQQFEDLDLE